MMAFEFTADQERKRAAIREFVDNEIIPCANKYDRREFTPAELIQSMARRGYLGAFLPEEMHGGMDIVTYGLLHEEIARGCSSLRSLLTVHGMVTYSIWKWGSRQQKAQWLNKLSYGKAIAAFALSEPNVGSDAKHIQTTATPDADTYILNGHKKWITYGQIADLFLVFAQHDRDISAFIVERDVPGLSIKPIGGMLGLRASMMAEIQLDRCCIPKENLIGRAGLGFSHIAATALDLGRYTVAWGCVGIAQACLEACVQYTNTRQQFGTYLKQHQLIQAMIANMMVNVKAARLLCHRAALLREEGDPDAVNETITAKYFASTTATKVASDAVQIHGANGCSSDYAMERHMRDAKIMEIIEGTTQIQQITIAQYADRLYKARS
jgi:glutaryl-CoA dehydrogenase (non-decarboxylating)